MRRVELYRDSRSQATMVGRLFSHMDSSETQHSSSPTEALWALVLQKDKAAAPPPKQRGLPQVPTGPVDRNATSTRILLYDTQARLEQFSSRADSMLKGIQDANHQLKQVGSLFEKDRDTLTNDMIDLGKISAAYMQQTCALMFWYSQPKPNRDTKGTRPTRSRIPFIGISRKSRAPY